MSKPRKDRIYAILNKPNGRGKYRVWQAFSFNPSANQSDVQAFMCHIHVSNQDYFLHMESDLEMVRPFKGSENSVTIFYYTSKEDGRFWIHDTPVFVSYVKKSGRIINRTFKLH